jgi:molybdopterin biosynthesis enzyme MoaB
MAEAMRAASLLKTPHAMISRAVVGVRASTLIVNLPGSPKGALENLEAILPALPHALEKIQGDTSDCAQS